MLGYEDCIQNSIDRYPLLIISFKYFRDCGIDEVSPDGNVTAHLLSNKSFKRPVGKSGHNLLAVVDIGIHCEVVLLPGYHKGVVPRKAAYWAHVSGGAKDRLPGGKC